MRDRLLVYESLWQLGVNLEGKDPLRAPIHHPSSPDCLGVLATLVEVSGSYYRRPGARALFTPQSTLDWSSGDNKERFPMIRRSGVISGGCLEQDLSRIAEEVFFSQKPQLFFADLSQPDEPLLGYGTGCPGQVRFLLEPLKSSGDNAGLVPWAAQILCSVAGAQSTGFGPHLKWQDISQVGILLQDGADFSAGLRVIETHHHQLISWHPQMGFKTADQNLLKRAIFWESPYKQRRVLIFGAGDDSAALVDVLLTQGFAITIFDHRPTWIERSQKLYQEKWSGSVDSPCPVQWKKIDPPQDFEGEQIQAEDIVILMTHQLERDKEILKTIIPRRPHYIGILGAHKRAQLLKSELMPTLHAVAEELCITVDQLWENIHAPMGKAPFFTDDPWQIGLTTAYEIIHCLETL